ncbi:hypothetical protein DPMN_056880 [Dreissena polymorpha]|uniref:Uncharacterized protein n=1 Tax=Dreissena polymorpha TaxID=45954 RepID=A0A9D4CV76_DREPO|nr:hypothetical protein DPMN_056880 [Dreissena polymorpha]
MYHIQCKEIYKSSSFPCSGWPLRKNERWRSSASQVCCWLLRVAHPWEVTSTLSNPQSSFSNDGLDCDLPDHRFAQRDVSKPSQLSSFLVTSGRVLMGQ